eukprot:8201012-Ditylum_brightwellii.AAC.1
MFPHTQANIQQDQRQNNGYNPAFQPAPPSFHPIQQGFTPHMNPTYACTPQSNFQHTQSAYNPNARQYFNNNYCWTHGCDIADNHTSQSCCQPAPGHIWVATRHHPMVGNMKDSHKVWMSQS